MIIEVMNMVQAEEYAMQSHKEKSVIISITSCAGFAAFIPKGDVNGIQDVLHLKFNDTDSKSSLDGGITNKEAKKIHDFVNKYKDISTIDKCIVHCEAGQSRSAGVAAAIMKYLNDDDTPIFNNHKYTPNMSCYRAVLNELMS